MINKTEILRAFSKGKEKIAPAHCIEAVRQAGGVAIYDEASFSPIPNYIEKAGSLWDCGLYLDPVAGPCLCLTKGKDFGGLIPIYA